jgi:hypothetical protein
LYPIWNARTAAGRQIELSASDPEGLISLSLPAGRHQVEIVASPLPSEIAGAMISAASLVVLLGLVILGKRRGEKLSQGIGTDSNRR